MSEEDLKKQELFELQEKQREEERIRRLNLIIIQVYLILYDAIHKRMLGIIMKIIVLFQVRYDFLLYY